MADPTQPAATDEVAIDLDGPTIVTDRLTLVPLDHSHASFLRELYGNADIVAGWGREPYVGDVMGAHLTRLLGSWRPGVYCQFAVYRTSHTFQPNTDANAIGIAGIRPTTEERVGELGYLYRPTSWGSGYGTEVAAALVAWSFAQAGLSAVVADGVSNPASQRLLLTVGFTETDRAAGGATVMRSYRIEASR